VPLLWLASVQVDLYSVLRSGRRIRGQPDRVYVLRYDGRAARGFVRHRRGGSERTPAPATPEIELMNGRSGAKAAPV